MKFYTLIAAALVASTEASILEDLSSVGKWKIRKPKTEELLSGVETLAEGVGKWKIKKPKGDGELAQEFALDDGVGKWKIKKPKDGELAQAFVEMMENEEKRRRGSSGTDGKQSTD